MKNFKSSLFGTYASTCIACIARALGASIANFCKVLTQQNWSSVRPRPGRVLAPPCSCSESRFSRYGHTPYLSRADHFLQRPAPGPITCISASSIVINRYSMVASRLSHTLACIDLRLLSSVAELSNLHLLSRCMLPRYTIDQNRHLQCAADHLDCAVAPRQYTRIRLPVCAATVSVFRASVRAPTVGQYALAKAKSSPDRYLPATDQCPLAAHRREFSPQSLQLSPHTTKRKHPRRILLVYTAENAIVHHRDGFLPNVPHTFVSVRDCGSDDWAHQEGTPNQSVQSHA